MTTQPQLDVAFAEEPLDLTDAELVAEGRVPLWRQPGADVVPPLSLKVAVVHDLAAEKDRTRKAAILSSFVEGLVGAARLLPRSRETQDVVDVLDQVKACIDGDRRPDRALTHTMHAIASALLTALSLRGLDESLAARAVASQLVELGIDLPDGDDAPDKRLLLWREHLQEGRFSTHLRTVYKSALALALKAPRPAPATPQAV
jgi:hypothetical protein